uniref:cytochrome c oxidase subunit II n=1 Tax=Spelaeomysis bottazzii TaxID=2970448 RepID=UPI002176B3DC|nr:cytochrome c oxidase subunit II [Spelaeomysis bottazzii]UUL70720.1 cytochrome c oxidase subunit II [Spelaeomysis bottazzii]
MLYIPMFKSLYFQDFAGWVMEELGFLHDHVVVLMSTVLVLVLMVMVMVFFTKGLDIGLVQNHSLEFIWSVMPAVVLVMIAVPSLRVLYLMDEVEWPSMTVKVVGQQWFWRYEYTDFKDLEFDSYMLPETESDFRLLDVDNRVILPYKMAVRMLITSYDVIHSWALPSIGVKVDAVPGRLNSVCVHFARIGVFFGQCSEICGANHSFMPIVIEVVHLRNLYDWMGWHCE